MKLYAIELSNMSHWDSARQWVINNVNQKNVTYFWPHRQFTFCEYSDAVAFMLVFNGTPAPLFDYAE